MEEKAVSWEAVMDMAASTHQLVPEAVDAAALGGWWEGTVAGEGALAAVEVGQERAEETWTGLVREDRGKVASVASLGPAEVGTAAVRWAAEAGERRSRSSHHQTHNLNTWSLRHRHRTQSPH
mgnify:CR=1 FL=1